MTNLDPDIIAAARKTVPTLTDAQWSAWLEHVEARGGVLTLPFDGGPCFAVYPTITPPCPRHASAMDQSE